MDRPALQQLLADITAGRVDMVVVYKIDRLTRSLADVAKIVEILDARGASSESLAAKVGNPPHCCRSSWRIRTSPSNCPEIA